MDTPTSTHGELLNHLKDRIAQLETQLSQVMAAQVTQPPVKQGVQDAENETQNQDLRESAGNLVLMAHNPNFHPVVQGLPESLQSVLAELADKPMLSLGDAEQSLARLWKESGATVPAHFDPILMPVLRGFVTHPPAKRKVLVAPLTSFIIEQLIKLTQPSAQALEPQMAHVQRALDDTGLSSEAIDPHTPEGLEAFNYLMAGQALKQTNALLKQQLSRAQAAQAEASTSEAS